MTTPSRECEDIWFPKLHPTIGCRHPAGSRQCRFGEGGKDSVISRTLWRGALICWFTFVSLLSSLQAQGVATPRVSGSLTDDSGAVLVGARVQAKNVEMGSSRSTITDSGGRF